jgi:flagellar hook-associated protein 2
MATKIENFITDFNKLQSDISANTKITVTNGSAVTSLLSAQHEVGDWSFQLEDAVFGAGRGSGSSISSLDALGIGFDGITGLLKITDSAKLTAALSTNASGVKAFFATAKTGFGSVVSKTLNAVLGQTTSQTKILQSQSRDLGDQITTMQASLDAEQARLEAAFTAMESMQQQMQSESGTLAGLTLQTASGSTSAGAKSTLNSSGGFFSTGSSS